jgi:di/tricarboxylate transporter
MVFGPVKTIDDFKNNPDFLDPKLLDSIEMQNTIDLENRTRCLQVPKDSNLIGLTLNDSRLGDAVDVQILCIIRQNQTALIPKSTDRFEPLDHLIVSGDADMISILLMKGIEGVFIQDPSLHPDPSMIEDDHVGLVEVILSPHSVLSGMTLPQIHFREKYGLTVLSIWRKGRAYRSGLRDTVLEFGDALLLYGPWEKMTILGREPDFLVLTETAQEPPRKEKAKIALTIMAAVLLPVMAGWVPIYIAVVMGAAFMILTKCLTMEEAYRYIEWKAVFLIAGMLPLGTALDQSGAAGLLAEGVVGTLGPFGPHAVLFGLLVITFLGTSIIPTSALVVLMVPIALKTSVSLGISPYALMMGIAMAASSSFTSPISHPANVLVMGPGGYRFVDYMKVGVPLTLVILMVLMLILPVLWPL